MEFTVKYKTIGGVKTVKVVDRDNLISSESQKVNLAGISKNVGGQVDEIRIIDKDKLKAGAIERAYKYSDIDNMLYTDVSIEKYHEVKLAKYCFGAQISPERQKRIICVIINS